MSLKQTFAAVVLAGLTGCASMPNMVNTRNYDVPPPRLPQNTSLQQAQQVCTDYANQVVPSTTMDTVKDVGVKGLIGAGVGAALGAITGGEAGRGALMGGAAGSGYGLFQKMQEGSPKDQAIQRCMSMNGYNIQQPRMR